MDARASRETFFHSWKNFYNLRERERINEEGLKIEALRRNVCRITTRYAEFKDQISSPSWAVGIRTIYAGEMAERCNWNKSRAPCIQRERVNK